MTDYRSEAEKFVTSFIDYMDKYDIKDELDRKTQTMKRSAGVEDLYRQASAVFPKRDSEGNKDMTAEERDEAIAAAPNVVDTREMFSRKVQQNGGVREMLRGVVAGDSDALERAKEFIAAEDGVKEFGKNV